VDIEVNRLTEIAIYTGEEPDENSIWIDDTTDARIQAGTLYLNRAIVDTDIKFGQLISGEFRVTIFNLGVNVVGRKIKVWIYDNNLRSELFTGTIDSAKHDHNNNYREIVAYDWSYEYRNINVADFWNDFWETNKDAEEIRLDWFRSALLNYLGIMGGAGSLLHDDLDISMGTNYKKVKTLTFESLLIMICEIQCAFPYVNAGGALDFVTIDNSNTVDLRDRKYQGDTSDWEDFTVQPITGVALWKNSSDMYFHAGDIQTNPYNITGNLFLDYFLRMGYVDIPNLIAYDMLDFLENFTYIPCSIDMIVSDLSLELGQRIRTEKGYSYIMANEISGSFFVEQTLECRATSGTYRLEGSTYNDGMVNEITMSTMEVEVKSGSVKYQHASNLYAVNIGSGAKKQVINLRFLNDIDTIVIFQAEILLQTDSTTDGQPTIAKVSYRHNEVENTEYCPIEEWIEDGHHILSLFYPIQLESAGSNHFEVYIEATDGSILIPANLARGWVYGAGIMASAPEWDGTINAEENLYGYEATLSGITSIGGMSSDVVVSQIIPHTRALSDTVGQFDLEGIGVNEINDILQINKDPLTDLTWGEVGAYTWGQLSDNYMW
jgi:hypothetical protein